MSASPRPAPDRPGPGLSPRTRHARRLFAGLADRYDLLAEVLSFGQNGRWRRFMVSRVPAHRESVVLDVATGTAGVARELVRRTGCAVVGVDPSVEMLEAGRRLLAADGRTGARIDLLRARAEELPFGDAAFDHLTFTYLLRYVDDPAATMRELARVLKPGGTMASLEFALPPERVWRAAWEAYTRVGLPVAGNVVSPGWAEAGRFLGPSIRDFYGRHPLPEVAGMWRRAGIGHPHVATMSLGGGVIMWGRKDA